MLTTGKELLSRVVFVVAWARNQLQANRSLGFCFEIAIDIRVSVTTTCSPNVSAAVRSPPPGRLAAAPEAGVRVWLIMSR